jgi:hypothetical protein
MMRYSLLVAGVALVCLALALLPRLVGHGASSRAVPAARERAHTDRSFEFVAHAPMARVAPLFGADAERRWAPGWSPDFIWPATAEDRPGMVFTVGTANGTAVWMSTAYDPANGHFQYAYVLPGRLATIISLALRPAGEYTQVTVTYSRTALTARADPLVERMAEADGRSGPEWQQQINDHLERVRTEAVH